MTRWIEASNYRNRANTLGAAAPTSNPNLYALNRRLRISGSLARVIS